MHALHAREGAIAVLVLYRVGKRASCVRSQSRTSCITGPERGVPVFCCWLTSGKQHGSPLATEPREFRPNLHHLSFTDPSRIVHCTLSPNYGRFNTRTCIHFSSKPHSAALRLAHQLTIVSHAMAARPPEQNDELAASDAHKASGMASTESNPVGSTQPARSGKASGKQPVRIGQYTIQQTLGTGSFGKVKRE